MYAKKNMMESSDIPTIIALIPALRSFCKLNSKPTTKSKMMIPSSAKRLISSTSSTIPNPYGPATIPIMIKPIIVGNLIFFIIPAPIIPPPKSNANNAKNSVTATPAKNSPILLFSCNN